MNPLRVLSSIARQPAPFRYVVGMIAWRTGWGSWHRFAFRGFQLRLFPSNLSWQMWLNPHQFASELDLLKRILPVGGTMVDVGANVGNFALEGASAVGPQGRVIAFEPHPRVFRFLSENLKLNPSLKITATQTAVSDHKGQSIMEDGRRDDMNALTESRSAANSGVPSVTVPTITLDEALAEEPGKIDLLKIDVEGAEMHVLRGAGKTLERSEALMIEAGDLNTLKFGCNAGDLLGFLQALGFHVRTTGGSRQEPNPEDFEDHVGNWLAMRDAGRLAVVLGA